MASAAACHATGATGIGGMAGSREAALLTAAAGVFLANGLMGSLLSVRASQDGLGDFGVGAVMSAFFLGLVGGAVWAPSVIVRAGHVRAFAAFASLSSVASLAFPIVEVGAAWVVLRGLQGVCQAGMIIVIESWLNAAVAPARRGRLLGLYGVVVFGAWGLSQPLLTLAPAQAFDLFALSSALVSLALVPIALARADGPGVVAAERVGLRRLFAISPVALIGCALVGTGMGAFWGLAPSLAQRSGLSESAMAVFLAAPLVGALVAQQPLGWMSDRVERRLVIGAAAAGATLAAAWLATAESLAGVAALAAAGLMGGLAVPLYPLCVAHANDRVSASELVAAASALVMAYGVGATAGPVAAGALMAGFGPAALFVFMATALGIVAVAALARSAVAERVSAAEKGPFVSAPSTSHAVLGLHPQGDGPPDASAAPR